MAMRESFAKRSHLVTIRNTIIQIFRDFCSFFPLKMFDEMCIKKLF